MFVYGVDFSGAQDAGRSIWIASGRTRFRSLLIQDVRPAIELPASSVDRDGSLAALTWLIAGVGPAAVGLDFPFSLPQGLLHGRTWQDWVLAFGETFPGPDEFRAWCAEAAGGEELKRETEIETEAPMSAYNLRLYRQTFYGIRDVLAPLVHLDLARVLPMQPHSQSLTRLYEVCPASTLKAAGIQESYKETSPDQREEKRQARERILEWTEHKRRVRFQSDDIRQRVLEDGQGDALDSILAAIAASRARPPRHPDERMLIEGLVYI